MPYLPYLPLYVNDYIGATRHLSTEEHGAYLLLLMEAWRRRDCRLPDDDALLARLAGVSPQKWKSMKPVIMEKWDRADKFWTNSKLSEIRKKVAAGVEQRSAAGKASGQKRKKNYLTNDQRAPNETITKEPTNSPTKNPTEFQQSQDSENLLNSLKKNPTKIQREIYDRLQKMIDKRWPEKPMRLDNRLLELNAEDFANEGANADVVEKGLDKRFWILKRNGAPAPTDLKHWRGDVVQELRRWVQYRRWLLNSRSGSDPWQASWGAWPTDRQIENFQIPEKYLHPGEPPDDCGLPDSEQLGFPDIPKSLDRSLASDG